MPLQGKLLFPQPAKEDGEQVVDASGQRIA
jgi:hypothetical protein